MVPSSLDLRLCARENLVFLGTATASREMKAHHSGQQCTAVLSLAQNENAFVAAELYMFQAVLHPLG